MKKLIAIAMVLVVSSVASAGLSLVWDVAPGAGGSYDISLNVAGDTGVSYVSINSLTAASGTISDLASALPNGLGHNGSIMDFGADYGAWGIEFATQTVTDDPISEGTVFSFNYAGTEEMLYIGDIAIAYFAKSNISGTDGADYSFSGLGIDVINVPEPMTMALLGLGGLFLRRRRA